MIKKPNVYFFNPTCELAVANGSFSYMPPELLLQMESELAILPFILATENDFVLTENIPSVEFVQKLREAGFTVPEFRSLNNLKNSMIDEFESILPWGWSPAAHFKLQNLKEKCSDKFKNSSIFNWLPKHKFLYERATSLNLLNKMLEDDPPGFFIEKSLTGAKVSETEEIEQLLNKHHSLVIKAPLSSSGRGVQIIRRKSLNQSNKQWISGILKQQNYVIAEPYLDKLLDLSFQFRITSGSELNYLGFTIFETNPNGQYKSSLIKPDLRKILPDSDAFELEEMINISAKPVIKALSSSDYAKYHRGFLGVDALIFRQKNKFKIQPCIEINSRMTMGLLSMYCGNQIHPKASGKLELYYGKSGNYSEFVSNQEALYKPEFQDGKIRSGFLSITEPLPAQKFGAYILLDSTI